MTRDDLKRDTSSIWEKFPVVKTVGLVGKIAQATNPRHLRGNNCKLLGLPCWTQVTKNSSETGLIPAESIQFQATKKPAEDHEDPVSGQQNGHHRGGEKNDNPQTRKNRKNGGGAFPNQKAGQRMRHAVAPQHAVRRWAGRQPGERGARAHEERVRPVCVCFCACACCALLTCQVIGQFEQSHKLRWPEHATSGEGANIKKYGAAICFGAQQISIPSTG